MTYILGAIAFIIVLMIIIIIHEMGHFLMARRAKILCYEFACGMGPILWKKKKGETVYSIRAIPIGGFVSMAGEEVDQDFLKEVQFIKLELDENNRVTKIICDISLEKYKDLPTYRLLGYDILGTLDANPDELYLRVKEIKFDDAVLEIEKAQEERKNKKKNKAKTKEIAVEQVSEETHEEIIEEVSEEVNEERTFIVNRDSLIQFNVKEEYQIAPKDRNMNSKSVGARFLTIFAGPFMNFVLALVLYFIIGLISGYPKMNTTKVSKITEGMPVYEVLEEGNEITKINGVDVKEWNDITVVMDKISRGNDSLFKGSIEIEYKDNNGNIKTASIVPTITVFAIELIIDSEGLKDNKIIVGESAKNNEQTKSYKAGLRKGDIITSIKKISNQDETEIKSINDLLAYFTDYNQAFDIEINYIRDGETHTTKKIEVYSMDLLKSQNITPTKVQLGVSPIYGFDFVQLLYKPWVQTGESCLGIFKTLKLLFTDKSVNLSDLSGPVGIYQLVTNTVSQGFIAVLSLMAFLSVNIGFVNLLPIPALDGGRLVFVIYEAITKKKPSPKVENIIHTVGFMLLMALFVFVFFSDITRCFGCR